MKTTLFFHHEVRTADSSGRLWWLPRVIGLQSYGIKIINGFNAQGIVFMGVVVIVILLIQV